MSILPVNGVTAGLMLGFTLLASLGCQQRRGSRSQPTRAETRQVTRVEELLERKPGVMVQRTENGGYSVRVRGTGSFMSSGEPLYLIDGVPMQVVGDRGLDWLSPGDVERIDVLRDPSQTSLYGVRGANGVILITTKRPR